MIPGRFKDSPGFLSEGIFCLELSRIDIKVYVNRNTTTYGLPSSDYSYIVASDINILSQWFGEDVPT